MLAEFLALHLEALAALDGGAQEARQRHAGDLDRRLEAQEKARARALIGGKIRNILPVEGHGARSYAILRVAHDYMAERRFAGAVRAHHDVRLVRTDRKVDVVEDGFVAYRGR